MIAVFAESMDYVLEHQVINDLEVTDEKIDDYMCELEWLNTNVTPIYSIVFATKTTATEIKSEKDERSHGISQRIEK